MTRPRICVRRRPSRTRHHPRSSNAHGRSSPSQHLFANVLARVHAVCGALAAEGGWPAGIDLSRVVVEPPRDAAHGDMATNAAMVLAKEAKAKPRDLAEAIAAKLRADDLIASVDVAGPGFINLTLKPSAWSDALAHRAARGRGLRPEPDGRGREGQCRIRLGQPDRADACRPLPGRGVRRCAVQPAGFRGLRRHARILHQRCRRPGRRARALGVPALSRGARRRHRRDSGRALSRRLSDAGRAGARRGIWRQAQGDVGSRLAAARAGQGHRHDDGHDQDRSRRAQHQARRVFLRAVADRNRQQQGRRDHRFSALQGRRL